MTRIENHVNLISAFFWLFVTTVLCGVGVGLAPSFKEPKVRGVRRRNLAFPRHKTTQSSLPLLLNLEHCIDIGRRKENANIAHITC